MVVLALITIATMFGFARSPSFETIRNIDMLSLFGGGFSLGILTAVAVSAVGRRPHR